MEITKHDMDMMKGFTKEVADHIRDINTIIEARQAAGWMNVHELEKYKEAVTDLFIKETTQHTLASKFSATTAPAQVLQGEISR